MAYIVYDELCLVPRGVRTIPDLPVPVTGQLWPRGNARIATT